MCQLKEPQSRKSPISLAIASRSYARQPGKRRFEDSIVIKSAIQSHSIDKPVNSECQVRMADIVSGRQAVEVPGIP